MSYANYTFDQLVAEGMITRENAKATNIYRWQLEQVIARKTLEAQADRAKFRVERNNQCANVINSIRYELVGA